MHIRVGAKHGLKLATLFVAYLATARIGLALDAVAGVATTVWPPSGIALGSLLIAGPALWPAIALAAFVANISVGVPAHAAAGIALGNTLEAVVGVFLLRRFGHVRDDALDSVRQVLALILLAALASTAISASVGVSSAWLAGVIQTVNAPSAWWNWWIGDALGILLVVPVMLGAAALLREPARPDRPIELAITFAVLCLVSALVFGWKQPGHVIAHAYAVFPLLFWVALRFRQPATASATLLVGTIAVIGTATGSGPFTAANRGESLLSLQTFMAVVAVTALILGAVTAEREKARRALAHEHAFVSAILDAAGLLVVLDSEGGIVRLNHALEQMLSARSQDVKGKPFWELLALPEERARVEAAFRTLVGDGSAAEWESRSATAQGSLRSVLWSSAPLFGAEGSIRYVISSGNDLTERKQLEARLVLADRLTAMGTLAAGVGHEINNPLAYLMLCLEMAGKVAARDNEHTAELERLLGMAREGAERVRRIVHDLKTLARSEDRPAGPVDVNEVLDSSVRIASNQIRQRAQLIKGYTNVPAASGDAGRLGQVFLNLLINAAHAIPEGHAERNMIRVSTQTDRDGRIVVAISDTGVGIEAVALDRLFDPFFTTKPVGEGVGLGLSICHTIVTSLGGSISVESEVGRGTQFRVALPASKAVRATPGLEHGANLAPASLAILVVDDESSLARSLAAVLDEHRVSLAESGREALALCQTREFDLIFCDLLMPGVTGMDFYEEVRKLRPGYEERIVFMTGGAFTSRAQQFLSRVPNQKIDKPFNIPALMQLIAERSQCKANLH